MSAALQFPDYPGVDVAIRDDLRASHRALLEHLCRPGCWFDGRERVALAAASREAMSCRLCRERREALSPEQVSGRHDGGGGIDDALLDVLHRVRVDPGRLSRAWFERTLDSGVAVGEYVEAIGIVAMLAGLDAFCRAIGCPPFPLPEPAAGGASRHVPSGLSDGIAWVPILKPEDVSGPEADLYPEGVRIPNIVRALSSVPGHVHALREQMGSHYVPLDQMSDPGAARALDRPQIELVASRVSALNECFY